MDATPEEWRAVVGYEGSYEVSNLGRVRSLDRFVPSRWGTVYRKRGQPMGITKGRPMRYHRVQLSRMYGERAVRMPKCIHVLVLEAFVGPRPPGYHACHGPAGLDDNSLSNLRWDTREANMRDSVRDGTHKETRKTRCKHGHPFDEKNTRIRRNGWRECRQCDRDKQRRKARQKRDNA